MKYSFSEYSPYSNQNQPNRNYVNNLRSTAFNQEMQSKINETPTQPWTTIPNGYVSVYNNDNMAGNKSQTGSSPVIPMIPRSTMPTTPTTPAMPGTPIVPRSTTPTKPATPAMPGTPTVPRSTTPATPSMPGTPMVPTIPTTPGTQPTMPATPAIPGTPTVPKSTMPANPATPGTPMTPRTTMPTTPSTQPTMPTTPMQPTMPGTTMPKTTMPTTPTQPTMPGTTMPKTTMPTTPTQPTMPKSPMTTPPQKKTSSFGNSYTASNDYLPYNDKNRYTKNSYVNPYDIPMSIPMLPLYGFDNVDDADKDWEYIKHMYPLTAKKIYSEIEDECDKLEYEGSCMFDVYPERVYLDRIVDRIYEKVKYLDEDTMGRVEIKQYPYHYSYDHDEHHDHNNHDEHHDHNNHDEHDHHHDHNNIFRNLIEVLLFNEILNRRRRFRSRRRFY